MMQCNSGWRTVDRLPGETSGWPGMLETCHDILQKFSPRLKETKGYFQDLSLTCTATSYYGLWLGWTTRRLWTGGASRCRRTVGFGWAPTGIQRDPLKDHVLIIRSSKTLKCEDIHGGDQILWGTCAKLCRVLKPNRLAVSTVMDNLSQRNWSYLKFSTQIIILMWVLLTTWVRELVGGTISLTTNNIVIFCF